MMRKASPSQFGDDPESSGMNYRPAVVLIGETHPMRHISATSMLLVFVLGMLAPACVAGWNGSYQLLASHCEEVPQPGAGMHCTRRGPKVVGQTRTTPFSRESRVTGHALIATEPLEAGPPCGDAFAVRPGQCGLRSFVQLHFASFRAAEISVPLLAAGNIASPSRVVIVVSSVGFPETDRGPPSC